jgi:hypothetical protein
MKQCTALGDASFSPVCYAPLPLFWPSIHPSARKEMYANFVERRYGEGQHDPGPFDRDLHAAAPIRPVS